MKALLWQWKEPLFKNFSLLTAEGNFILHYLTVNFQKDSPAAITPFSENIMVNTGK